MSVDETLGEQYAIPYRGYNTGADGRKLFDVSFEDYGKTTPLAFEDRKEWSQGDAFGISFDGKSVVFTHNGRTVHTRDASGDYITDAEAKTHVAFPSHWHLQGTPVYDLSFSAS